MGKVYIAIASVVVITLAALLVLRFRGGGSESKSPPAAEVAPRPARPDSAAARPSWPGVERLQRLQQHLARERAAAGSDSTPARPVRPPQPTVASRKLASYPPRSQPLKANQAALLHPERPVAVPRATREPANPDEPASYHYTLTSDRRSVVGDEAITFTLELLSGGARVNPAIGATSISWSNRGRWQVAGKKVFRDDGKYGDAVAGDKLYSARVTPAKLPRFEERAGSYALVVEFRDPAGNHVQGRQPYLYTPQATVPARFTGELRDSVKKGSLVVSVQISVVVEGEYVIAANLFGTDGTPIAYTSLKEELEAGEQWVELLFFGKLLRDGGIAGPYEVRSLRGDVRVPGQAVGRYVMASTVGTYQTRAYTLDDFSNAAWQN